MNIWLFSMPYCRDCKFRYVKTIYDTEVQRCRLGIEDKCRKDGRQKWKELLKNNGKTQTTSIAD